MFTSLLTVFVAALAVSAAPVVRIVPTEICTTKLSGYLTGGSGTGVNQTFGVAASDSTHITYSSSKKSLKVDFQVCNPNFSGYPNKNNIFAGHLYVPSLKKCLAVPSSNGQSTSYDLLLQDCDYSSDSGQFESSFLLSGSKIYWSGATSYDGSLIQNKATCPKGLLGFQGSGAKAPLTKGFAKVVCATDKNALTFRIAASA